MDRNSRVKMMEILDRTFPNPKAPLSHESAFQLLVAVILSAQCTDVRVNQITPKLFEVAGDAKKMAELGEEKLKTYVRSCGYYNAKAKNIVAMSRMLILDYNGQVPDRMEELIRLPGVAEKTASCILTQWYRKPAIAVDTHYFRVANRTGFAPGNSADQVYRRSFELLPVGTKVNGHEVWLDGSLQITLHGRYVCTARKPKCLECPIYELCEWEGKSKK